MSDNLIYQRWDLETTVERCYAIHWLKCCDNKNKYVSKVRVFRNSIYKDNLVEVWSDYVPRKNNFYYGTLIKKAPDTGMIFGYLRNKHTDWIIHGCMPATKEAKYLKNYRVD